VNVDGGARGYVTQTSGEQSSESAATRWAAALAAWAIPESILDAAPVSPWSLSPDVLRERTREFVDRDTPSRARALEALPPGGTVLDVGVGAGAGSLPLAPVGRTAPRRLPQRTSSSAITFSTTLRIYSSSSAPLRTTPVHAWLQR
jgi:hypothetical protein